MATRSAAMDAPAGEPSRICVTSLIDACGRQDGRSNVKQLLESGSKIATSCLGEGGAQYGFDVNQGDTGDNFCSDDSECSGYKIDCLTVNGDGGDNDMVPGANSVKAGIGIIAGVDGEAMDPVMPSKSMPSVSSSV